MKKEDIRMLYLLLKKATKLSEEMCEEMLPKGCEKCPLGTVDGYDGACAKSHIDAAEMSVAAYIERRRTDAHVAEKGNKLC